MKIKKGDKVKVIAGKDLGKTGLVLKVVKALNKVVVEGINIMKKHVKPGKLSKDGGIIKKEAPIHVSNVMYMDAELDRPVRLGNKIVDGRKYRTNRITKEVIEK